jgi:hypothetical protein
MEPRVQRILSSIPVALCLLALAGGCDEQPEPSVRAPRTATTGHDPHAEQGPHAGYGPAGAGGVAHGSPATAAETRGTVRETMNAAGYTYLRIEPAGGASSWVAAIEMPLEVGDEVVVEGGSEMVDFHSRTLDRTFDRITFASSVRVTTHADGRPAAAPAAPSHDSLPPGHPPMGTEAMPPTGGAATAPMPTGGGARGVVRETMNAASYTYMRVEGAGGSVWVAVPEMTVAVGDQVEVAEGMEMPGFHSGTLDRTFEQITFAPGARVLPP